MKPTPWTCPYCGAQIVTDENISDVTTAVEKSDIGELGPVRSRVQGVVCLNPKCKKLTLHAWLYERTIKQGNYASGNMLHSWPLLPESNAKPQPEYYPKSH
jgi:hypothetical protein